jgi:hypothetical protein
MRKLVAIILLLLITLAAATYASYSIAERQAEKVAQSYPGPLSPLKAQLALYGIPGPTPCWVFRAEYSDAITGAMFEVYVSLLGNIIKIPPRSKVQP